ncbi:MAG: acetyl-CoA C-acyltransferase [Pseudomonadota bacterium]
MTLIYDAVRTPRGRGVSDETNPGGLNQFTPQELVRQLVNALVERGSPALPEYIGMLMLSCVGQVDSQGGHIALVSKLASSLRAETAAFSVNNYCAGGLSAINLTDAWSRSKPHQLALAGGVEMLSQVPFLADRAHLYCDASVSHQLEWTPAPLGSEVLGAMEGFTRADLDAVSLRSHQRAAAAWSTDRFSNAVIPMVDSNNEVALATDEWVRADLTLEQLARLPTLFKDDASTEALRALVKRRFPQLGPFDFTHTPGHVPGFTDGAALTLMGSAEAGRRAQLSPRAEIIATAEVGGDHVLQFGAGFAAMEQALNDSGMTLPDIDLIEFMEAFAAAPLRFERRYQPDMDRVNPNGGHLAMGHPMGATGAVLTSILLDELELQDKETGMVVTLGATGIGSAMIVRRTD